MLKFLSDIASVNCPRCSTCLEQFPGMKKLRMCMLELKTNMVWMVIVVIKFAAWMVT